jgi:hypothetical protein
MLAGRPQPRAGDGSLVAYALGLLIGATVLVMFGFVDVLRSNVATTDFAGFWAGPRALLDGGNPYDPATWQATVARLGTQPTAEAVYGYPPWVLVALLPLALLPLGLATLVWTVGGLTLAVIGVWRILRVAAPEFPLLSGLVGLCLLGSTPAIISFYSGQWSFVLVGAVALAYAAFLRRRERSAALLWLAVLVKPHLFVFATVALARAAIARGWTVFVATAAIASGLLFAGVVVLGWEWVLAWLAFIPLARAGSAGVVTLPNAFADLIGPAGQWVGLVLLVAGVVFAASFNARTNASLATWTALSAAAVVYGWSYDHLLLLVPLVLAAGLARNDSLVRGRVVAAGGATIILAGELGLYQVAAARGNQSFNAFVPAAFAALVIAVLWPQRGGIVPSTNGT